MLLCVVVPKEGGWKLFTPDLPKPGLWYRELQDAIDYAKAEPSLCDRTLHVFDAKGNITLTISLPGLYSSLETTPPSSL